MSRSVRVAGLACVLVACGGTTGGGAQVDAALGASADASVGDASDDPDGPATIVDAGAADATAPTPTGTPLWLVTGGLAGNAQATALAVDADGSVTVVGMLYGPVDFGGVSFSPVGPSDVFVARYSPAGSLLWAKRVGGCGADVARSVAALPDHGVVLVGAVQFTASQGCGPTIAGEYLETPGDPGTINQPALMVRYTQDGDELWGKLVGGSNFCDLHGAQTGGTDHLLVAGRAGGPVDFGGGAMIPWPGPSELVARVRLSDGRGVWATSLVGPFPESQIFGVGLDDAGHPVAVGTFRNTLTVGSAPAISAAGAEDVFAISLDARSGALRWQHGLGGAGYDGGFAVARVPGGGVAITGSFTAPADVGGGPVTTGDGLDELVTRFDAAGAVLGAVVTSTAGDDHPRGLAIDADDHIVGGRRRNLAGYLERRGAGGGLRWSRELVGEYSSIDAVGVSPTGDAIYAAGVFLHDLDAGLGVRTTPGTTFFLLKVSR
jgi:hypothetical protein